MTPTAHHRQISTALLLYSCSCQVWASGGHGPDALIFAALLLSLGMVLGLVFGFLRVGILRALALSGSGLIALFTAFAVFTTLTSSVSTSWYGVLETSFLSCIPLWLGLIVSYSFVRGIAKLSQGMAPSEPAPGAASISNTSQK